MSSFTRTVQKRALKRHGYARQTVRVVFMQGQPMMVRLRKGEGNIIPPGGTSEGSRRWPVPVSL